MVDANEHERELEARVSALEARLRQVEGRLDGRASAPAEPVVPIQTPPPLSAQSYWSASTRAQLQESVAAPAQGRSPGLGTSLRDLEARLTGRALAWVGGLALVLGLTFFLSLAFSRGWIGPEYRVLIGYAAGVVLLAGGAVFMERGNRLLGHVLTAVGLAAISISLVGATRLYELIPVELGLGIALAGAVAAAVIAIRANSPIVAGFGLISVLAAPPLLDAPADVATLAFVGVVLIGTTGVAVWRSWTWLPAIAFVLAAPQGVAWIEGKPDPAVAIAGLSVFWLLNALASGGEEVRRHRNELSPSSAILLVASTTFLVWAGFTVLSGGLQPYRGPFLVAGALVHVALGGWFVVRDGERNLFGLLTIGMGIALLTMAAPAQLGSPAVPIAWTAEAVALTWLAVRRGHPYGAAAAASLFVLASAAIVWVFQTMEAPPNAIPFLDGPGAALTFYAAGIAAGALIVRDQAIRATLVAWGLVIVAWCVAERLNGLGAVVALTVLTAAGVALLRLLTKLPEMRVRWQTAGLLPDSMTTLDETRPVLDRTLPGATVIIAGAAIIELLLDSRGAPEYAWAVVIAWAGLAAGPTLLVRLDESGRSSYRLAAFLGLTASVIVAPIVVAPPTRLVVTSAGVEGLVAVQTAIAQGIVVAASAIVGRSIRPTMWRRWVWIGVGVALFYLLSVAAVDLIAIRVGGGLEIDELETQGQVALTVMWAASGVTAFIAGLRWQTAEVRLAGLGVLGLATAKVFLFDLGALEIAYRVISLIALGLLLLISAWVWQRLRPRTERDSRDQPV